MVGTPEPLDKGERKGIERQTKRKKLKTTGEPRTYYSKLSDSVLLNCFLCLLLVIEPPQVLSYVICHPPSKLVHSSTISMTGGLHSHRPTHWLEDDASPSGNVRGTWLWIYRPDEETCRSPAHMQLLWPSRHA